MKMANIFLLVGVVWLSSWVASEIVSSYFQEQNCPEERIMTPALVRAIEEVIAAHEAQKELNEKLEQLMEVYREMGVQDENRMRKDDEFTIGRNET